MAFTSVDEQEAPRLTPAVQWLIALNVAVFFIQLTLVGPADVQRALAFEVRDLTTRPWTIVTYMFVHAGFWHLLLNMWMLWMFGPRVERAWNARSFTFYYVLCGLGGWLFHLMIARDGQYLLGASAAIFGVMLAYAMRWPDDEVLFFGVVPMRMRWLLWLLVAVNVTLGALSAGRDGGGVAYLAHLGGLAFGLLYLLRPTAPSVDRLRQRVATAPDLADDHPRPVPRSLPRPRERQSEVDEVVEQSKALTMNKPPRPAPPPPQPPRPIATAASRREALDLVLDKISESGLDSLTLEERTLLEEMSRTLRDS